MTTTSYNIYQQITSVRVGTTANLASNYFNGALNNGVGATLTALSVGALTIDGVLLEVGDRVLVKNQTSSSQNGLYVVQSAGGFSGLWMLERAPDFQSVEQLKVGQYFTVGAGDTLAGSMFVLVEPLPETIGLSNFTFIDVGESADPSGPFLLKAANLSDLVNRETGFTNLGLGSGDFLIIDESDFVAGLYTLTNPCPNLILVNATTPGNAVRLPPVDEAQSFIPSQGPVFFIDEGFEGIDVQDSTGAVISPLEAPACEQFVLTSNAFPQGVWFVRSFVSTVNGKSGDVVLSNSNQMIYVSTTGSDSIAADGSILNPYASVSYALSQITTASQATPFEIVMATGVYNELGDVSLKPWVHIEGNNAILNIAGQLLLHASWGTVANPRTFVRFMNINAAGGALLNRTVYQANSLLFFNAVNFSSTPTVSASGAGTNVDAEIIAFFYCLPINGAAPVFTLTNLISVCIGSGFQSGLTVSNTSAVTNNIVILENSVPFESDLVLQTTNAGTLTAIFSAVPRLFGNFTVDGTNVQIITDSTSWNFTPLFLNGATVSQFILNSKSDGVNCSSFVPTSFTPIGSSTDIADSLTAYLRGIDAAISTLGGGVIPSELIFVDGINGNDANTGSISSPLQTYEAARLLAVSRNPQYGTGQTIVVMTTLNSVGNMTISPFVSVVGFGKYCQIIGISGDFVLDPLWGNTPFGEANISNIALIGQSINFTFNTYTDFSIVRFENCSLQLLNAGPTATIIGSDGSGNTNCETVIFLNCTQDLGVGLPEPQFISDNVNLLLLNTSLSNLVQASVTSATITAKLLIENSIDTVGNITLNAASTGTLTTSISASNTSGSTLTLNGTSNTVNVDASSYQFASIVFAGGATLADINLLSLSDGIDANQNFTPANYTPVASADYQADSVTGNLKGIDNALAGFIGGGIQQQLWVNDADGNDAFTGGISDPFKTYAAAAAFAALSASPTNRYVINLIGDQTSAGPVLYPYVDLCWYAGTWTVTGGLSLDASWDTVVNNEVVTLKNMKLDGFWGFSWIGNTGNVIKFLDCDHSLTTSGNFLSNSPALNTLMIINDTAPSATGYSSDLFITQSNSYLQGAKINNEIRYDILQNGYALTHYLYDSQIPFGIILKKSLPNTSTQDVYVKNTPMPTGSPVLEDDLSNVIIDYDSYQNTPTLFLSGTYSNIQTVGVNATPIYIYKNSAIGNDNNNGSINSPLATYEAARLLAISRGASSSQTFVIQSIGSETITGDMTLSANISVQGNNSYSDGYFVNGNVVIDPNWGSGDTAYTQVRNMYLYLSGGNYTFTFTNPQVFSFLKFVNVAMNTGGFINITGSGDAISGFRESVTFENCTNDLIDYADGFIAENVDLYLINTDISVGSVTMTASTALATNYNLVINNARFNTDDITVITNNLSTLTTRINACETNGQTLTINGANNTVIVDSSSYMFTLALAGGATLSNLTVASKTDGLTNSSYSPTSYTPVGDTLYAASTLTGNLKGIDNALAGKADIIPYTETSNLTNVMAANNEYTANNAAVVSLTLPITAPVGSTIRVNGKGAGGWRIDQQNAGHVIHVGAASTTVGAGGSLASATQYASITLRCITANDVWEAISFAGTFTPV